MMRFDAYLSDFHDALFAGTSRTLRRALRQTGCGGECMCGGGHVEVEDRVLILDRLPMAVLAGDREPTEAEVKAALAD